MHGTIREGVLSGAEIEGRLAAGRDKIVTRRFGAVAKVLWPEKTAACLAAISGKDERTAKRWMAGEFEPPAVVLAAVLVELTRTR